MSDKLNELKRSVLKDIQAVFEEEEVATIFTEKGEEGAVCDSLSVLFAGVGRESDEMLGEFMFLPGTEDSLLYFSCFITFDEELNITPSVAELLSGSLARLNFVVPVGSFVFDENSIAYKLVTVIPASLDKDTIYTLVNANMAHAIEISAMYVDKILGLVAGSIDPAEFLKAITPDTEI